MIENAFKHGISYKRHMDILITVELLTDKQIHFMCENSKRERSERDEKNIAESVLKI